MDQAFRRPLKLGRRRFLKGALSAVAAVSAGSAIAQNRRFPAPKGETILIVGAGLSGIGAAWHLQKECPGKSYAIVEARAASGGTWDLFRYPGVRSDSDMYTLGYR